MPLARFDIEQIEGNRWVAEVEAGGFRGQRNFEHRRVTATSFEGVIAAVSEFYYRQVPPAVSVVVSSVTHGVSGDGTVIAETPAVVTDEHEHDGLERAALRSEAKSLGVDVDKRWSVKRLHAEIAKAKAGETVVG